MDNLKILKNEAKIGGANIYVPVELIKGNTRDVIPFFKDVYDCDIIKNFANSTSQNFLEVLGFQIFISINKDMDLEKVAAEIKIQKKKAEELMVRALKRWKKDEKRKVKEAEEKEERMKKENILLEHIKSLDI